MSKPPKTMSGAEFKMHFGPFLASLKDDDHVYFGGGDLSFNRLKDRGPIKGPRMVNIELNELYTVTFDPNED